MAGIWVFNEYYLLKKEASALKISAVQNHFSLLHRTSERAGILDYCKENGIIFYAYMVLEQGALTGKYDTNHPFPVGTGRGDSYNPHLAEIKTLVSELQKIGEKYNASPAQIATAWAIAKGTLPIIGVTKVKQVEEAAAAAQIILTSEEVSLLEKLGDETGINTLREYRYRLWSLAGCILFRGAPCFCFIAVGCTSNRITATPYRFLPAPARTTR
jgi:aryl-alcohol dehydrogenase-like predicted oxidoreductase